MVNLIKQCQFVKGPVDVHRRGGGRSMRMDNSSSSTPLWTTFAQTIVPGLFNRTESFFIFFATYWERKCFHQNGMRHVRESLCLIFVQIVQSDDESANLFN